MSVTYDREIMKAYIEAKKKANEVYKKAPKYGSLVEDCEGTRYVVLEANTDLNQLERYDDGNVAKDYANKLDPARLEGALWLAVSDPITNKVGVFIFGKDGLDVVVQSSKYSQNETRDVINALKKIINDEGQGDQKTIQTPEDKANVEEENKEKYQINVEGVQRGLILDEEFEKLNESIQSGKIENQKDLYDYATAIARRAFQGKADKEMVKAVTKVAYEKYKKANSWIPAIGHLKQHFQCFRPGSPEAQAYGPFIKKMIERKQEAKRIAKTAKIQGKKIKEKAEKPKSTASSKLKKTTPKKPSKSRYDIEKSKARAKVHAQNKIANNIMKSTKKKVKQAQKIKGKNKKKK